MFVFHRIKLIEILFKSSIRMCVECALGILKCRWRIIMKRMECPLKFVPDVVAACIVLNNICILSMDRFDREWIQIMKIT